MAQFGKPNATGRSSGIRTGKDGKWHRPPKGEPWVWHTRELLSSPAWRAQSVNTRRLIDFLEIEHMNHAGTENGKLKATHDQLRAFGLSANLIRDAIEEAAFLGLLRYDRGGRWALTNQPSIFRLTFLPDREGYAPTNDWKRRTEEEIKKWNAARRANRIGRQKQKAARKSESTVLAKVRVPSVGTGNR